MAVAPEARKKVEQMSHDDARELLDRQAQRYLGMSGAAFVEAWEAGAFAADSDRPEVMRVAMLLPFGR